MRYQLLKRLGRALHLQDSRWGVEGLDDWAHQVAQGDQVLLLEFLLSEALLEDGLVAFEQLLEFGVLVTEDLVTLSQLVQVTRFLLLFVKGDA